MRVERECGTGVGRPLWLWIEKKEIRNDGGAGVMVWAANDDHLISNYWGAYYWRSVVECYDFGKRVFLESPNR